MRRSTVVVGGLAVLLVGVAVALYTGVWVQALDPGSYDRTTVTVVDDNGTELGAVEVRIAETRDQRIVGLSRTDSLARDEGMLFVHESAGRHEYVMRGMAFPLDIVFVAPNGTITTIHHAAVPPAGTVESGLERYPGHGQYVLEVTRGWTNRTGTEVGDRVVIPNETTAPASTAEPTEAVTDRGPTTQEPTPTPTATPAATPEPTPTGPTVTAVDADGTELATVSLVAVADNGSERYTGLSETDELGRNEGMLFVYGSEHERAFVMRNMSFPLDMLFVAANGTITTIHHASTPENQTGDGYYVGQAQYVLEVNRGWANRTGVDEGDRLTGHRID